MSKKLQVADNFKFQIGQMVEHKLGIMMVVIMQSIRITSAGSRNNWYLCRFQTGIGDWFAEVEFK